jgi:hypothetical protein
LLAQDHALWCILATFVRKLISPWFAEFTANAAGAAIAPTIDSAAIKAVVVLVDIILYVSRIGAKVIFYKRFSIILPFIGLDDTFFTNQQGSC